MRYETTAHASTLKIMEENKELGESITRGAASLGKINYINPSLRAFFLEVPSRHVTSSERQCIGRQFVRVRCRNFACTRAVTWRPSVRPIAHGFCRVALRSLL